MPLEVLSTRRKARLALESRRFSAWMIFRMSAYSANTPNTCMMQDTTCAHCLLYFSQNTFLKYESIVTRKHVNSVESVTVWDLLSRPDTNKYKPAYPGLHRRQTLRLGRVSGDRVEDVDQDEEERHQQRHPACAPQYKSENNFLAPHSTLGLRVNNGLSQS